MARQNATPKLTYKHALILKKAIENNEDVMDMETSNPDVKVDYFDNTIMLRIGTFDVQYWNVTVSEIDTEENIIWVHCEGAPFRMGLIE